MLIPNLLFCSFLALKGYRCASVFAMIGFLAVLASSFYLVVTVDHSTITTSIFPRKWLEIPSVVPVVMGNFNGHTNAATFYNEYESSTECLFSSSILLYVHNKHILIINISTTIIECNNNISSTVSLFQNL